jgi:VCBS repeat-containing protein
MTTSRRFLPLVPVLAAIIGAHAAEPAYVKPTAAGVTVRPIATVGETGTALTSKRMVGIPDGLGAYDNLDGTFTLVMNQELGTTVGITRAHGNKGAFVSKWTINKTTLKVSDIQDFNQSNTSINLWSGTTGAPAWTAGTTTYARLCSADLAPATAFVHTVGSTGTTDRIFLNGEETGDEGRSFAHVLTGADAGKSYELPHLGKASWENWLAYPAEQAKTVVIGLDDTTPGQVYVYVGNKQATGSVVEKAGLVGGTLFGIIANGLAAEDRTTAVGGAKGVAVPFTLASIGDASTKTGAVIQAESVTAGVTQFLRPEDGAWDPITPGVFYFVTTDRFDQVKNGGVPGVAVPQVGRSRLWKLQFTDITNPTTGGTITMLIDGSENPGPQMMDNMCVDSSGRVIIQEDPGGNDHAARIWGYDIVSGRLVELARHDPALFKDRVDGATVGTTFGVAPTGTLTNDEESSGIIDASSILGAGWYLFVTQAHNAANTTDTELVEGGQLQAMYLGSNVFAAGGTTPITPYLTPIGAGVVATSIFTVGESANPKPDSLTPYRMVGIPDGLGAFDNGDGTFTVLLNHEIGTDSAGVPRGVARAHGNAGSFVSRWTINKSTLQVTNIQDHNQSNTSIYRWSGSSASPAWVPTNTVYYRLCSADLAPVSGLLDSASGKGTAVRLFLSGEETGPGTAGSAGGPILPGGRLYAHVVSGPNSGRTYELPHLGKMAWENALACPKPQVKTIVAGMDDTGPEPETANAPDGTQYSGQVYFYVGEKNSTGATEVEKAGLVGGTLYGVKIGTGGVVLEDRTTALGAAEGAPLAFSLASLGDVSNLNARGLEDAGIAAGITNFLRPEDGAWDPNRPEDFYFATTDRFDQTKNGSGATVGRSRLWRLRFTDISNPALGGTITMLIDGSQATDPQMMDNLCVDQYGRVIVTEDPGGNAHSARIWSYTIAAGALVEVGKHDTARFGDFSPSIAPTPPFTNNEEASGIIDVSDILGAGKYLVDVQAHYSIAGEQVEGGQLLALAIPPPANTAPVGVADTVGGTMQAGKANVISTAPLVANDTDANGDPLLITAVTATSSGGGAVKLVDGKILYTPLVGQTGADTITYTVTDGARVSQPIARGVLATSSDGVTVWDSGFGSGLYPVPGVPGEYLLTTDRGPNVAGTAAGEIVFAAPGFAPNIQRVRLNADGSVTLVSNTVIADAGGAPVTGIPNPVGAGGTGEVPKDEAGNILPYDPDGLDSEETVVMADGTMWVSDEYGPWLVHLDATGKTIERVGPYAANAQGHKLPAVLAKRTLNRGMEGLTKTPSGKLVGLMQSALQNGLTDPQAKAITMLRVVVYDPATGVTKQYPYLLQSTNATPANGTTVSACAIVALSDTEFYVLERDGRFPSQSNTHKKIWRFVLTGATDISGTGDTAEGLTVDDGGTTRNLEGFLNAQADKSTAAAAAALLAKGITVVAKDATPVLDIIAKIGGAYSHDKIEGFAVENGKLVIVNDDDFGVVDGDPGKVTVKAIRDSVPTTADYNQLLVVDPTKLLTATATITVSVNAKPTVTAIADQSLASNAASSALAFTIGDTETAAGSLVVTVASSNTTLVPLSGIVIAGTAPNHTVTVTPAANQAGVADITITVTDGGGNTVEDVFRVTVTGAAPTISNVADSSTNEDTASSAIAVTVGDTDSPVASLAVTASSSNPSLTPTLAVGGSGAARTVTITPAANQNGTATITLTVTDSTGQSATDTFVLTVTAVNDAPVAAAGTATVAAGAAVNGTVTATDADAGAALTYSKVANPTQGTVTVNANGTYTYTANSGATGTDTFTFKANDGTVDSNTATVTVTITAASGGGSGSGSSSNNSSCGLGGGVGALVLGFFLVLKGLFLRRRH